MPVSIKIGPFGPIAPRTAERQLPELSAQVATNVDSLSNELRAVRSPLLVSAPMAGKTSVFRAEYSDSEKWRGWSTDVDVAKVPLSEDNIPRYVWTGDGPPKWSNFTNFDTEANDLTLGIPTPITVPTVAPSGGVGAADTRVYCYTFFSQDGEESGPSPATDVTTGKVDDTWAVSNMDAFPTNSATILAMPSSFFVTPTNTFANATGSAVAITSSTNASPAVITKVGHGFTTGQRVFITGHATNTNLNNTPSNPTWKVVRLTADTFSLTTEAGVAVDGNGVGGATGNVYACTPHWLRVDDLITTDLSATQYTIASIPSAYSFTISSTTDLHTAVTWTRVAEWNTTNMKRRLYRSAGTNATFQLVTEDTGGTSYNDTISDYDLPGDELISQGWQPPPVNLTSVYTLPNGCLVGLTDNVLHYSEPYQAHAWPDAYKFGLAQTAVGLAAYGTTVVVGTAGAPYIADGGDPSAVTLQRIDDVWPCLAKRSVIPSGDGVVYATFHGLAYVGPSGPKILTKSFYTRSEWDALNPSSMICASVEGKIFVRCQPEDDDVAHLLLFIPDEPLASLTTLGIDCVELYADQRDGRLYIVDGDGAKQYDAAAGARLTYEWMSREFETPAPVNFGAARVEFVSEMTAADAAALLAAYEAAVTANAAQIAGGNGAINMTKVSLASGSARINGSCINGPMPTLPSTDIANVTFTLFSDGEIVFSKTLYDSTPFRMPAGYKSDVWAVKLNGKVRVKNVKVAETMTGLKNL